jgi:hypothetical protein
MHFYSRPITFCILLGVHEPQFRYDWSEHIMRLCLKWCMRVSLVETWHHSASLSIPKSTRMRKVGFSWDFIVCSLPRDHHPVEVSCGFPQSIQPNARIVPQVRPQLLSSISFLVHYSLFLSSWHCCFGTWSEGF